MANVFDYMKAKNSYRSLKYYGAVDIITGVDISRLIENGKQILDYYTNKKTDIDSFDDYIDYLYLVKICGFNEIAKTIIDEEKRKYALETISKLTMIKDKYEIGKIIVYISNNIGTLLNHSDTYYDLADVTISICAKYQKGITNKTFLIIAKEHSYFLISNYYDFQKRIERTKEIVIELFETITSSKELQYNLRAVLCVLQSIFDRKPELFTCLEPSIERIIDLGASIAHQADKDNVLQYDIRFNAIYEFLKHIKSARANEFAEYKVHMNELLALHMQEHGTVFSYKMPTDEIIHMLGAQIPWLTKLLCITHCSTEDGLRLTANLNKKPHGKHALIDVAATNRSTNEYFTVSHQNYIEIILNVGGLTAYLMLKNKSFFGECLSCMASQIQNICEASNCTSSNIEDDFQLLIQMLHNVFHSSINEENQQPVLQSLCYGVAMFICAFVEKLLRSVYISLKRTELYVPINKATLGELLSGSNDLFKKIFGEYQLRHLNYFFCTDKDGVSVGYNYRNTLAHWHGIKKEDLTLFLVSNLFFLLMSIINSLFIYFISIPPVSNEKEVTNDQL